MPDNADPPRGVTEPAAPTAILIRGGLDDGDPTHATAGALTWHRKTGEPFAAFEQRAKADTMAAGEVFVVLGGLPSHA